MSGPTRSYRTAIAAGALLLAGGCSESADRDRTLPDSTLIEVLMDLQLAGARQQIGHEVPPGLRDTVLARHGLDSISFLEAMAWYEAHPDEYVAVYGTVVDRLAEERDP